MDKRKLTIKMIHMVMCDEDQKLFWQLIHNLCKLLFTKLQKFRYRTFLFLLILFFVNCNAYSHLFVFMYTLLKRIYELDKDTRARSRHVVGTQGSSKVDTEWPTTADGRVTCVHCQT